MIKCYKLLDMWDYFFLPYYCSSSCINTPDLNDLQMCSEISYCEISKEMSLYLGLAVFCQFEPQVPIFDAVYTVQSPKF
jgi:hypothetical protein